MANRGKSRVGQNHIYTLCMVYDLTFGCFPAVPMTIYRHNTLSPMVHLSNLFMKFMSHTCVATIAAAQKRASHIFPAV